VQEGSDLIKNAVGFIETIGLAAGIEAADTAVKSANVKLIGYELARGDGMTTVKIEGDVGAVKAAITSAKAAASRVGTVVSVNVIPRPAPGTELLVFTKDTVGLDKPVKAETPRRAPKTDTPKADTPKPDKLKPDTPKPDKAPVAKPKEPDTPPVQDIPEAPLPPAPPEAPPPVQDFTEAPPPPVAPPDTPVEPPPPPELFTGEPAGEKKPERKRKVKHDGQDNNQSS
jgi:microcompartment protein CcmL/EutN